MAKKPMLKLGALAAVGAVALGTFIAASPSQAASAPPPPPAKSGSTYLALGDSIAFGYEESNAVLFPSTGYTDASKFVGYPEIVAKDLGLKLTNAACPGETSKSFVKVGRADNGCSESATGGPGYRTAGFPLHVTYASASESQLDYALAFLKKHPHTKLISLQIGANDGLRCIANGHCDPTTQAGFLKVLTQVNTNLNRIFRALKNDAHYTGQLVLVNYYSINTMSKAANGESVAINNLFKSFTSKYKNLRVANAYWPWRKLSLNIPTHDTCQTGLETILSSPGVTNGNCGIHPSVAGANLIAGAVEKVVKTS